jgi:hypothetical protein
LSAIDLSARGLDCDKGAFELLTLGEAIGKVGNGGDLVGLLGHGELRRGELVA